MEPTHRQAQEEAGEPRCDASAPRLGSRPGRPEAPLPAGAARSAPGRRPVIKLGLRVVAFAALLVCAVPLASLASSGTHPERPRELRGLLAQAARERRPVVAMFSIAGCPWCEAIRREQMSALSREQAARGIRVVEFDMHDERAFVGAPKGHAAARRPLADSPSPAALARRLGVRIAPTLVFLGPDGELAEPLVGYGSPDFFSAYLDERIERARSALAAPRSATGG